ncbi:MAG TPA: hypothetical protein VE685_00780 [Thermoanaerobaculia bacterium]|nr:hypothetical protein [Thermoanaerobaculia bacterium]
MSDRLEEARRAAELRLETTRREAEQRLAEVRSAIRTEVGFAPNKKYLLLALTVGAIGFTMALRRGRRRKKLASHEPSPRGRGRRKLNG